MAATAAMSAVMVAATAAGAAPMPEPIPAAVVSLLVDLPRPGTVAVAAAAHLAYGAGAGAVLTALVRRVTVWSGAAYGVALWVLMGLVLLPSLGWGLFGTAVTPRIAAATLVLHLVYGITLGLLLGRSARRRRPSMSEHETGTPGGSTGPAAPSATGGDVCGPECVGAEGCTCGTHTSDTAPERAADGRSGGGAPAAWTPPECTLPVVEQPQRAAEFDGLFADAVREVRRPEPTELHLVVDPGREADAGDLAARESACCSFFAFAFTRRPDGLHWRITVPDAQVAVLDALAERAAAALEAAR